MTLTFNSHEEVLAHVRSDNAAFGKLSAQANGAAAYAEAIQASVNGFKDAGQLNAAAAAQAELNGAAKRAVRLEAKLTALREAQLAPAGKRGRKPGSKNTTAPAVAANRVRGPRVKKGAAAPVEAPVEPTV